MKNIVTHKRNSNKELWWCNSHQRRAEYIQIKINGDELRTPCCDPKLGGIMIPCRCVELTGEVEIDNT